MARTLREDEEGRLFAVHCSKCDAMLGFFIDSGETLSDELARMETMCMACTKKAKLLSCRKMEFWVNGQKWQTIEVSEGNEITNVRIITDDEVLYENHN